MPPQILERGKPRETFRKPLFQKHAPGVNIGIVYKRKPDIFPFHAGWCHQDEFFRPILQTARRGWKSHFPQKFFRGGHSAFFKDTILQAGDFLAIFRVDQRQNSCAKHPCIVPGFLIIARTTPEIHCERRADPWIVAPLQGLQVGNTLHFSIHIPPRKSSTLRKHGFLRAQPLKPIGQKNLIQLRRDSTKWTFLCHDQIQAGSTQSYFKVSNFISPGSPAVQVPESALPACRRSESARCHWVCRSKSRRRAAA